MKESKNSKNGHSVKFHDIYPESNATTVSMNKNYWQIGWLRITANSPNLQTLIADIDVEPLDWCFDALENATLNLFDRIIIRFEPAEWIPLNNF